MEVLLETNFGAQWTGGCVGHRNWTISRTENTLPMSEFEQYGAWMYIKLCVILKFQNEAAQAI